MKLFKNTLIAMAFATIISITASDRQSWYNYTNNTIASNFLKSNITKDIIDSIRKSGNWSSKTLRAKAQFLALDIYDRISNQEDLAAWANQYKQVTGRDPEKNYDGDYQTIKEQIVQYMIENAYILGLVGQQSLEQAQPLIKNQPWYDYTNNTIASNFLKSNISKDIIDSIPKTGNWPSKSLQRKAQSLALDIYDKIAKQEDLAAWANQYKQITGRDPEKDYDGDYQTIKKQIVEYMIENAYILGLVGQ